MSIDDLISDTLDVIRSQFYPDQAREFKRDETALMKAIARWGYECNRRGWAFDAAFIQRQVLDLLNDIKRRGLEIGYLPVYLHGAVGRWIGQRAEELQTAARRVEPHVTRIIKGVRGVEAVVEKTDTEILDALYRDLRRKKRRAKKPGLFQKQAELFNHG